MGIRRNIAEIAADRDELIRHHASGHRHRVGADEQLRVVQVCLPHSPVIKGNLVFRMAFVEVDVAVCPNVEPGIVGVTVYA